MPGDRRRRDPARSVIADADAILPGRVVAGGGEEPGEGLLPMQRSTGRGHPDDRVEAVHQRDADAAAPVARAAAERGDQEGVVDRLEDRRADGRCCRAEIDGAVGVTRVDPEFGRGSDGAGRSRTGAIVEPSGHQLIGALGDARLELPQVVGEPDADGLGRVGRIQVEDDRMRSRLAVEVHRFEGRGMHRVARLAMGDAGAGHADGGDPGIHRAGRLRRERGPERATARRGDHPAAVGSRARGVSTPGTAVGADAEA